MIDRIGDPGKKLHTGRSRNDQVALDMKLFTRDEIQEIDAQVKELLEVILHVMEENVETYMPDSHIFRKHSRSHWLIIWGAYFEMFRLGSRLLQLKTYEEAVGDRWKMDTPMPEAVKKLVVYNVNEVEKVAATVDFVFSAVDMTKDEIKAIEEAYAKTETPVVSNNSAHRWTPDVPMMVPEINADHAEVIEFQKKRLGTERGFVAVKPNCSIQSYAPVLTAWMPFEPYEVIVSTYQAISGAGKTFKDWPEMLGNIIPYIGGEEEKSEKEPLRIWGKVDKENGVIVPAEGITITSQCIRVPVLNVPLLERMKFVAIFTSNLDEFFMIRVGSLYDMVQTDEKHRDSRSGMTPQEQLDAIYEAVAPLYKERDKTYTEIKKELSPYGICGLDFKELEADEKKYVKKYFKRADPSGTVAADC